MDFLAQAKAKLDALGATSGLHMSRGLYFYEVIEIGGTRRGVGADPDLGVAVQLAFRRYEQGTP